MTYQNCADAYAHGAADIPRSNPSYAAKLDRDGDGIACEVKDAPPGFVPRTAPAAKPTPKATATVTGTKQPVAAEQLPVTGPASEAGIVGGLLLATGAACLVVARRRRRRFTP